MSSSHENIGCIRGSPFLLDDKKIPQVIETGLSNQFSVLEDDVESSFKFLLIRFENKIVNNIAIK